MRTSSKRLLAIGLFTILLTLLVNIAWWMFYKSTADLLDQQLSKRLAAVGHAVSVMIDPPLLNALANDDLQAYLTTVEILERIRSADSLAEIFILRHDYQYLARTSIETDSLYLLGDLNGQYIDSLFFDASIRSVVTPSYQTGEVFLKTAFVPLRDSTYFTTAVLGVEANVDYFDVLSDLKLNLYYSTAFSILGGLIFGLLFLFYQKRFNQIEQKLFLNETHSYLGRMVAVVSHEIKNPLMIIRASAERLAKKTEMKEAGFVIEEVDRLNQIVTGYLDFARTGSESSARTFVANELPEQINLTNFFENLRKHLNDKYHDHTIKWLDKPIDDTVTMNSYPRALRQILLNLLINGAEACLGAGKEITLGLHFTTEQNKTVLTVRDMGPGIPKKQISKIITPFYTTRANGSGLGLYLCQEIINEMNGKLIINSTEGEGTIVSVELPLEPS